MLATVVDSVLFAVELEANTLVKFLKDELILVKLERGFAEASTGNLGEKDEHPKLPLLSLW